jgi:hypothetical protein
MPTGAGIATGASVIGAEMAGVGMLEKALGWTAEDMLKDPAAMAEKFGDYPEETQIAVIGEAMKDPRVVQKVEEQWVSNMRENPEEFQSFIKRNPELLKLAQSAGMGGGGFMSALMNLSMPAMLAIGGGIIMALLGMATGNSGMGLLGAGAALMGGTGMIDKFMGGGQQEMTQAQKLEAVARENGMTVAELQENGPEAVNAAMDRWDEGQTAPGHDGEAPGHSSQGEEAHMGKMLQAKVYQLKQAIPDLSGEDLQAVAAAGINEYEMGSVPVEQLTDIIQKARQAGQAGQSAGPKYTLPGYETS